MATAALPVAAVQRTIPAEVTAIVPGMGQAATDRVRKRYRLIRQLQLRGEIKPATLLNLSPFRLGVRPGLINFSIPPCQEGKQFSLYTVTEAITYALYGGNTEMSDRSVRQQWDVKAILPIEQLMEFFRAYSADLGYEGVSQGGMVIFEGDASLLKDKDVKVKTAEYLQEGLDRYLVFTEARLTDLLAAAKKQLYAKALRTINQCNTWWDKGPGSEDRKNIGHNEHTWADYALREQIIRKSPEWRHTDIRQEDSCEKCNAQYVSKVGVCKCGFVREPLVAYLAGEITSEHVRLQTLDAAGWAKVNTEEARRKAARGGKAQPKMENEGA